MSIDLCGPRVKYCTHLAARGGDLINLVHLVCLVYLVQTTK
jgi:hypothetical protein